VLVNPYISPTPFRDNTHAHKHLSHAKLKNVSVYLSPSEDKHTPNSNPHSHILSYLPIQVRHLPTTTTIDWFFPKQKSLSFEPFLLYHSHRSNALWPSLYGITISQHCFLDFPLFFHLTQIAYSSVHTLPTVTIL